MKKKYFIIIMITLFIASGCSSDNIVYDAASLKIENNIDKDAAEEQQIEEELFESNIDAASVNFCIEDISEMDHLNLDGSGDNDDKLYAARYYLKGNNICFTLVQVTLGTGDTMAIKYDGNNFFSIYVSDLKNTGRDCIVLELNNITSTFGSTEVHVLEVMDYNEIPPEIIERLTILDGYDGTDMASSNYSASRIAFYKNTLFHIPCSIYENKEEQNYPQTIIPGVEIVDGDTEHIKYLRVSARDHSKYYNQDIFVDIFWDGASWCVRDYDKVFNIME